MKDSTKKLIEEKRDEILRHVFMRLITIKMNMEDIEALPEEVKTLPLDEAEESIVRKKNSLESKDIDEDIRDKLGEELEDLNTYVRLVKENENMEKANTNDSRMVKLFSYGKEEIKKYV